TKEKIKEMMQLVPVEDVYVQALQVKHPIIDWKVHKEGQRSYWKIIRLGGSSACYQFFVDLIKQLDREDLNQLWALVKEYLSIRPATSEKEMELWGGPIAPIDIQAMNFRLKNDMIQKVQNSCQFHGLPGDDAIKHLDKFLHVTQSIKVNGVTDDALRLYLFPHSLTHHATAWFDRLPRNSINTFEQMAKMFLRKYFPLSMVTKLRNEITNFHTFYNGLTLRHRDTINAAAGGTFMKRRPEECYDLIENITAHHNDWDTLAQRSNTINNTKEDLKGITTQSGTAYQGPTIPTTSSSLPKVIERETEVTKDTPVVAPVSAPKPNQKPSIPYPSKLHDQKLHDKANDQKEKFFKIFQDLNFNISFADALILMPKFGPSIKSLLTNKDKLYELARTSTILLKKLPEKLRDPGNDFLLEEVNAFLALEDDPTSPKVDQSYFDPDWDILLLEAFLNNDPSLPPPNQGNYFTHVQKELKIYEAKSDKSLIDEPPEVELKDLTPHLEYAFLEGDDNFPVIISKDLCDEEKTALITILKSHKRAITWKLSDIKGIDPEFCTHKILMEDDFEPAVHHQRRVYPKIHDVIKKEVLKLLDAGLIYPISDSPWVSPVHYVPKKGGFTVVENEENELIPTRLVTGWRVCIDYHKLNEATRKDHFPLPFMD
nr:reverse transcriptase domain-containing protein [Tanacetum cinerariifolium]